MDDAHNMQVPNLLPDAPVDDDAFGGHLAVAKSISSLVKSDLPGMCIALSGAWGSGKSSVIRMIGADPEMADTPIFVFDTWSNQGDPLRFSFMTMFVSWCRENFPRCDGAVSNISTKVEEIGRSRTEEEVFTESNIPESAFWFLLSIVVGIPLGSILISDYWLLDFYVGNVSIAEVIGTALILLPVVVISWIRLKGTSFRDAMQAVNNAASRVKSVVVRRGPLATALEFERIVGETCSQLGKDLQEHKLIIVFDNIDRVAESNSAKVWSLLSALRDVIHSPQNDYHKYIWILVPIDSESIPIPVGEATKFDPKTSKATSSADNAELRARFVEKTFQLSMPIPAQLPSDWEVFFEDCFSSCFRGSPVEKDWRAARDVYSYLRPSNSQRTPRAIKRFVNNLAAVYLIRQKLDSTDVPSVGSLAFFVCKGDVALQPREMLSEGFVPADIRHAITDNDPRVTFAALSYGVSVNDALEVLVESELGQAISGNVDNKLSDLYETRGFANAFSNFVGAHLSAWTEDSPHYVALALSYLSEMPDAIRHRLEPSMAMQMSSFCENAEAIELSGRAGAGLAAICRIANLDANRISQLASRSTASDRNPDANKTDYAKRWIDFVRGFSSELTTADTSQVIVHFPEGSEDCLEILGHLDVGDDKSNVRYAIADGALDGISASIKADLEGSPNLSLLEVRIENLLAIGAAIKLEEFAASFVIGAGVDKTLAPEESWNVLKIPLLVIKTNGSPEAGVIIADWMKSGAPFHHLVSAPASEKLQMALDALVALAACGVRRADVQNAANASQGISEAVAQWEAVTDSSEGWSEFVSSLDIVGTWEATIDIVGSFGAPHMRDCLIRHAIKKQDVVFDIPSFCSVVLTNRKHIDSELHVDITRYALDRLHIDNHIREIEGLLEPLSLHEHIRLGEGISDGRSRGAYFRKLGAALRSRSADWWVSVIVDGPEGSREAVKSINQHGGVKWIENEGREALSQVLGKGEELNLEADSVDVLVDIYRALVDDHRHLLNTQLVNRVIANPISREMSRIQVLGDAFFEEENAELGKLVVNGFIPALEANDNAKDWIRRSYEGHGLGENISRSGRRTVDDLLRRLESGDGKDPG